MQLSVLPQFASRTMSSAVVGDCGVAIAASSVGLDAQAVTNTYASFTLPAFRASHHRRYSHTYTPRFYCRHGCLFRMVRQRAPESRLIYIHLVAVVVFHHYSLCGSRALGLFGFTQNSLAVHLLNLGSVRVVVKQCMESRPYPSTQFSLFCILGANILMLPLTASADFDVSLGGRERQHDTEPCGRCGGLGHSVYVTITVAPLYSWPKSEIRFGLGVETSTMYCTLACISRMFVPRPSERRMNWVLENGGRLLYFCFLHLHAFQSVARSRTTFFTLFYHVRSPLPRRRGLCRRLCSRTASDQQPQPNLLVGYVSKSHFYTLSSHILYFISRGLYKHTPVEL